MKTVMDYSAPIQKLACGFSLLCLIPAASAYGAEFPVSGIPVIETPRTERTLTLYAKDPASWEVLGSGPSGTLFYNVATRIFSFTAVRLSPHTGYTLARYAGIPPYIDLLAQGKTDESGRLHLTGAWSDWTKKIWLVLSTDVTRTGGYARMTAWRPDCYLFEEKELVKTYE
jgi:hypothetical protein